MIALLLAATLYTTTEKSGWTTTSVDAVDPARDAPALFATDGVTPRTGSVPWRAWGTTFNELDLDALKLLKPDAREEILSKLFSPDGDLKFTRGRITMNANDYSRAWYSCSAVDGDFELKHFSHFVKPGAIQLAYTPWTDKVKALCYRNPDGGIVVVMTNWADAERRVSFTVAGKFYSLALKPHSFNTVTL